MPINKDLGLLLRRHIWQTSPEYPAAQAKLQREQAEAKARKAAEGRGE